MALSTGYVVGPLAGASLEAKLGFFHAVALFGGVVVLVVPLVVWGAAGGGVGAGAAGGGGDDAASGGEDVAAGDGRALSPM